MNTDRSFDMKEKPYFPYGKIGSDHVVHLHDMVIPPKKGMQ